MKVKFPLQANILQFPLLTIQKLWIGVIIGLLSRTYTNVLGTLAMANLFLMLKEALSTILHHISFFTAKFKCSPRSTKGFLSFFCKEILSFQALSLGGTTLHITPVLYRNWVCSLNFQALQPCSSSRIVLSVMSHNLTYNSSSSNS